MNAKESEIIDGWKAHVLACGLCSNAKSPAEICPVGRSFWGQAAPVGVVAVAPVEVPAGAPTRPVLVVDDGFREPTSTKAVVTFDARMAGQIAEQVVGRVIARSSTGAAIAVPAEKTSRGVTFSTAPNVTMAMPERDIEVYAEMQILIRDLVAGADVLSHAVGIEEEVKRVVKAASGGKEASEENVGLIVRQARGRFGIGSDEQLTAIFHSLCRRVLRMGDRLGNFMRVDVETQRIMRNARVLGIEMQEVLERSGGVLTLDVQSRAIAKPMRLFAIDLQGEIERRVGTP